VVCDVGAEQLSEIVILLLMEGSPVLELIETGSCLQVMNFVADELSVFGLNLLVGQIELANSSR